MNFLRKPTIYLLLLLVIFSSKVLSAGGPDLKLPMGKKDWNNDVPGFVKGKIYVAGGYGALNVNALLISTLRNSIAPHWDHVSAGMRPTWFLKGEYAITAHSGVGLYFAHSGLDVNVKLDSVTSMNIPISGKLSYRTWSALARYNYHFIAESNVDLYIGLGIGFRNSTLSVTDNDLNNNRWNFPVKLGAINRIIPHSLSIPTVGGDLTLGFRYHFLPPLAVYCELGLAKSFAQGGFVVRF